MFDIGWDEMLFTVIIAIIVIGPKDLPQALRVAGGWLGKMRRISGHFRSGIETMIREAELEEMEKKWREQNEAIMKAHPATEAAPADPLIAAHAPTDPLPVATLPAAALPPAASAEAGAAASADPAPQLPLGPN
jgi:sec-independent protein translocase protein TatB